MEYCILVNSYCIPKYIFSTMSVVISAAHSFWSKQLLLLSNVFFYVSIYFTIASCTTLATWPLRHETLEIKVTSRYYLS